MSGSDFSGSDGGGTNTRCSPKRIAEVVRNFGALKRQLVTEIGFKGMLKVPEICNLDKKFTLSLLDKIDIKKRALKLTEDIYIEICAKDVHGYLDIPHGPNKLFGLEDRSPSEKMDFIKFGIGSSSFDIDEKNSLKAAEQIVSAHYPNGMTEFQKEQFKVSFVCFCMGNFLMAKYSSNHGIKDYWGTLMKPSDISSYDFCQAVVDELIEAARHVQKELRAQRTVKNVSGCHLYLQAKFLDSINLGELNVKVIPSPRIQAFTQSKLLEMKSAFREISNNVQKNKTTSSYMQQVEDGSYAMSPVRCDEKVIEEKTNTSACVQTVKKHRSTEYLTAYTSGAIDRRLNDKEVDDLRLHNARLRLCINNFKKKTISEMDGRAIGKETCKLIFNQNVNKLLEDALDQVLVLAKSLHEHHSTSTAPKVVPTAYTSSPKRTIDQTTSGYESGIECAPVNREKMRNFRKGVGEITGKTLFFDLTEKDWTSTENTNLNQSDFRTPENRVMRGKMFNLNPESSTKGGAKFDILKNCGSTQFETDMFKTPKTLLGISSRSPAAPWASSGSVGYAVEDVIDLNELPDKDEHAFTIFNKIGLKPGSMAKNPWFYGVARGKVDVEVRETFYNWLCATKAECLDSMWVKHCVPKEIKVHGNDMKSVFTRGYNFTSDMMDMAIRRFAQIDVGMYGEGRKLRWMHPFESDFASTVLMGEEDFLENKSTKSQLTVNPEVYDISNCRMVAVPHISQLTWTSYFWDMKERTVHVVDPTFESSRACELHEMHAPIVDKLQEALAIGFGATYEDWPVNWGSWSKNYVKPFLEGKKSNESGMLTLLALRKFNGAKFETSQTEGELKKFAHELLYDVMCLQGNLGVVPDVFLQAIE